MTWGDWIGFAGGVALIVATFASVLDALIVPRGRPARFALVLTQAVGVALRVVARRFPRYESRDRILVLHGPLAMLLVLVAWLALLVAGFGLVFWPLAEHDIWSAMRLSGSSLFTLGFAASDQAGPTGVAFLAAAAGMVVVALQIAYLPTIYGSFNRRETLVTLLESRAGAPAWGPELLWRHQRVDLIDSLPAFYTQWEAWAADVAESHTTYPVLVFFRSPNAMRSWVTSLIAVLDSAALFLALAPSQAPSQARLCLRMGFTSVRDLARVLGIPHDPDPSPDDPIELPLEEFLEAAGKLVDIGFPVERPVREAWLEFKGWRVNYESVCYALADLTAAPPARWSGPRRDVSEGPMAPHRPVDRRPGDPEGLRR